MSDNEGVEQIPSDERLFQRVYPDHLNGDYLMPEALQDLKTGQSVNRELYSEPCDVLDPVRDPDRTTVAAIRPFDFPTGPFRGQGDGGPPISRRGNQRRAGHLPAGSHFCD